MLLLASKATEILGVVFVILVIVGAFGLAIWQLIKMNLQKKKEAEIKRLRKLEKEAKKNKKGNK